MQAPSRELDLGAIDSRRAMALLIGLAILATLWFGSYPYRTLMGDDLGLIWDAQHGGYASSIWGGLFHAPINKYRPVFEALMALEIRALGDDFRSFLAFNIFFEVVNAAFLSALAWRLSRGSWLIAAAAGALLVLSRFSYYYVLQVMG